MKPDDPIDLRPLVVLLVSILLVFVVYPFVEHLAFAPLLLQLLFTAILVAAALSVSSSRAHFLIAVALLIPSLLLRWAGFWWSDPLLLPSQMLSLLFTGYVSWMILVDSLRAGRMTAARICGVLAVYMLLGIMWGVMYTLVEHAIPGSFQLPVASSGIVQQSDELFYFSFMTLTTVGYGDVVPLSTAARGFAIVQALCGQLYLAVIVARLIGLHLSSAVLQSGAEQPAEQV